MIKNLLSRWPVYQQIKNRSNGNGSESWSERTRTLQPKTAGAEVARSICPYCAVGCGQMIYHKEGKLISIEGDPHSPISRGHLCPKGANTFQLHTAPNRIAEGEIPAPLRHRVGRAAARPGDGHDRRPSVGVAGKQLCRVERRPSGDEHHEGGSSGRSDAR